MVTSGFDNIGEDVVWLSWDDVMDICRRLAKQIDEQYGPDLIVGIARGGVIPAAIVSCMLRKDFYPIRLSRRWQDQIVHTRPQVLVPMTDNVKNKQVLIVDEMSESGETLRLAAREADKKGARKVKTAALYTGIDTWQPTWYGFATDSLVILPWDKEVLISGQFELKPEYRGAIDNIHDQDQ